MGFSGLWGQDDRTIIDTTPNFQLPLRYYWGDFCTYKFLFQGKVNLENSSTLMMQILNEVQFRTHSHLLPVFPVIPVQGIEAQREKVRICVGFLNYSIIIF